MSIPLIGYAPFLQTYFRLFHPNRLCVNSLNRVRSISTLYEEQIIVQELTVSIPLIGYAPFLPRDQCRMSPMEECVNSLNRVRSISTRIWKLECRQCVHCVNSLNRVRSISTVAPHTPLKSRLSSSIFAGNCLNILTVVFSELFFCLFKNCTDIYTIL